MTDKQIIIDGVDVSECEGWCSLTSCEGFRCVKWNILKVRQEAKERENLQIQLDQLKAENEKLKNFHINLVGVKECEIRELAELEAENRSLKAYIKILENNKEVTQ